MPLTTQKYLPSCGSTLLGVGIARSILELWSQEHHGQWGGRINTSPLTAGWSPEPLLVPWYICCICGPAVGLSLNTHVGVTLKLK